MNQSRAFVTSLIFAGIAMMLVFLYVNDQQEKIEKVYGEKVTVLVTAKNIQEFQQFKPGDVTFKIVPKSFMQPGAITISKDDEENRVNKLREIQETVAAVPFKAGEQITATKVLQKGTETGLAGQVAISHRALSIPAADLLSVGKLIKPGDRVDIITQVGYRGENGQEFEVKTLLQNVNVLAVGEQIQNNIPSFLEVDPLTGNTSARNLRRDNRSFTTVTVEVLPLEAQNLIYMIAQGSDLFLTLRNPVDRAVASALPTTTVDEVLGPNSKKAMRARPIPVIAAPIVRQVVAPPAPPNPFLTGGGSSAK